MQIVLPTLKLEDVTTEYVDGQPVVMPTLAEDEANGENNGQHKQHNISRDEER